eukprot:1154273-Pelagomonas_calceolata.AAC.2
MAHAAGVDLKPQQAKQWAPGLSEKFMSMEATKALLARQSVLASSLFCNAKILPIAVPKDPPPVAGWVERMD